MRLDMQLPLMAVESRGFEYRCIWFQREIMAWRCWMNGIELISSYAVETLMIIRGKTKIERLGS